MIKDRFRVHRNKLEHTCIFIFVYLLCLSGILLLIWHAIPPGFGFMPEGEKNVLGLLTSIGVVTGILSMMAIFNTSNVVTIRGPQSATERNVEAGQVVGLASLALSILLLGVFVIVDLAIPGSLTPRFITDIATTGVQGNTYEDRFVKYALTAAMLNGGVVVLCTLVWFGFVAHSLVKIVEKWLTRRKKSM